MKPIRSICVYSVLLACAWSGLALAQGNPNLEASQHFERGLSLAKQKAYPEAITEFNRAYQVSPHFSVMYNLGQAYIANDQPVYAVEALRRYLTEGGAEVPVARRQQVEDAIIAQEQRIAIVIIRSDAAGAAVRVDGNEVGRTPLPGALRVSAGSHVVEASLPGHKAWEQHLVLAGKEQRIVDVVFAPASAAAPVAPAAVAAPMPVPQASPTPEALPSIPTPASTGTAPPTDGGTFATASPPRRSPARIATAIVLGVVGAGGIVTGSVFGLRAFSKKSDSDKECPNERCTDLGVSLNNQAKDAATLSTITFGVGIVAVAVATYLLIRPGAPAANPAGSPVSALELVPELGNGSGGLSVRGVW